MHQSELRCARNAEVRCVADVHERTWWPINYRDISRLWSRARACTRAVSARQRRPAASRSDRSARLASRRRDFCFLAAHIASQMSDNEPPCKMEISVREKRPRPRRIYMRMPVTRPRDLLEPRFRPFFPRPLPLRPVSRVSRAPGGYDRRRWADFQRRSFLRRTRRVSAQRILARVRSQRVGVTSLLVFALVLTVSIFGAKCGELSGR